MATLRLLTFTTLYPNAAQPTHGVFVENRLRHLIATGEVAARVVAPIPWFPFDHPRFGAYAPFARAPRAETRAGIAIDHPRFPVIPKVGGTVAPVLLHAWTAGRVRRIVATEGPFDLIDGQYLYPDGVAAARIAAALRLPLVLTARGQDVTLIPQSPGPRRRILAAVARADAVITVSRGLKDGLMRLGADGAKITVLRNGVDLSMFRPTDRAAARARLGLDGPTILSVGHLITRKGNELTIAALPELPGVRFLLVGDGPEKVRLEVQARTLGVAHQVRFLGRVPHEELGDYYTAADLMVLASSREGWANVLLESMACGTPVVATDIPGTDEVVTAPEAGLLVARTPAAIADGIRRLLAKPPDRAATRAYAEGFGWEPTTRDQLALYRRVLAQRARAAV
jgi:glycosyltransferase involved in cell wall biosynthesis